MTDNTKEPIRPFAVDKKISVSKTKEPNVIYVDPKGNEFRGTVLAMTEDEAIIDIPDGTKTKAQSVAIKSLIPMLG